MKLTTTIAGLLLLALMACGGGSAPPSVIGADPNCPTEGGEVAPNPRPASTAEIKVLSPEQGELIEGDSVVVRVDITGACILAEAQTAIRPDTGHVHISLQVPGESEYRTITQLAGSEYTVPVSTPGSYTLEVGFFAADHGPFSPPVLRTVRFRVAPK